MSKVAKGEYSTFMHQERMPDGEVCIVASHPELPGCTVYGRKDEDVYGLLSRAREMYLDDMRARGEKIPAPATDQPREIIWYSEVPISPTRAMVTA